MVDMPSSWRERQASWCFRGNHGSIRGSWPAAISVIQEGITVRLTTTHASTALAPACSPDERFVGRAEIEAPDVQLISPRVQLGISQSSTYSCHSWRGGILPELQFLWESADPAGGRADDLAVLDRFCDAGRSGTLTRN
jgi:hypothetical protein